MIPTEDIMPTVKNTITASIKCNTHRGYIGWSSCDNICMDMHDCLDMCAETLAISGYMVALESATYILVSGVKLASHADSSSGMLTDVIMCTYELIEKCAKEVEKQDKQMRDQALALIIKEAKKLMISKGHTYYQSRKLDRVPKEAVEELLGITIPDKQG